MNLVGVSPFGTEKFAPDNEILLLCRAARHNHNPSKKQKPLMTPINTDESREFTSSVPVLICVYQCHPRLKSLLSRRKFRGVAV